MPLISLHLLHRFVLRDNRHHHQYAEMALAKLSEVRDDPWTSTGPGTGLIATTVANRDTSVATVLIRGCRSGKRSSKKKTFPGERTSSRPSGKPLHRLQKRNVRR